MHIVDQQFICEPTGWEIVGLPRRLSWWWCRHGHQAAERKDIGILSGDTEHVALWMSILTDLLQDMDASHVQRTEVPHTALLSNRVPTRKNETLKEIYTWKIISNASKLASWVLWFPTKYGKVQLLGTSIKSMRLYLNTECKKTASKCIISTELVNS
jgi:hypothetical protein